MEQDNERKSVAVIQGKATCNGFTIKASEDIARTSYFSVLHNGKTYVLSVKNIWREKGITYANLRVISGIPETPFDTNSEIRIATPDEIKKSLGLEVSPDKALNIGKLVDTEIDATFNVEKLGRLFITGKSGSGKSHTVGVIIEELIKKQIAILIIDVHGEYSSLKLIHDIQTLEGDPFIDPEDPESSFSKYIIEFGKQQFNPGVDLDIAYLFACTPEEIIKPGQCTIVNLRGFSLDAQQQITDKLLNDLFSAITIKKIPPFFVFIDEAHNMAGKQKVSEPIPVYETTRKVAQEGRKFGMNLVIITQRPQLLDVTLRAQAGTWIIHKLTDTNDVNITCKSAEGLNPKEDVERIQSLAVGEAIICGEITPVETLIVKIRSRHTVHGGAGYNILDYVNKEEDIHKADLISELKNRITSEILDKAYKNMPSINESTESDNSKNERKQLDDGLSEKITELQNEIMQLKSDNEKLKKVNKELEKLVASLKSECQKEKKRADDAVAVAEKALKELKKKQ